jgi:predicted nucleic acid-binding protein
LFDTAITNASPLIYLGRAGHLGLLESCARTVYVPETVVREIRVDAAALAVHACVWLRVVPVTAIPPEIVAWNLDAGESAVLAWALANPGACAVIDDREGRRCASQHGIPVIGTLGLVLAAKRRGVISAARPLVEALIDSGLYLSEEIVAGALALVGE